MKIYATLMTASAFLACGNASIKDQAAMLQAHNVERARFGIAPLVWNEALAQDAAKWARSLAKSGEFEHAPQKKQGENIWSGTKGEFSVREMIGAWIDEKRDFINGRFPDVSKTGDFSDVGHFTQVVWQKTTHVGCAVARGQVDDFLVCRYTPAGNVSGTVLKLQAKTTAK